MRLHKCSLYLDIFDAASENKLMNLSAVSISNVARQVVRFLLPAFSVLLIIWVFIDVRVFIDVMNYALEFSTYVTRVNEFAI